MTPSTLQALLQLGVVQPNPFPPNSRYATVPTATLGEIVYLRRRFVPPPEVFTVIQQHTVLQGERLDLIAAQYLGDPEMFWRLCDANRAVDPDDLTATVGRKLNIKLPQGIPGNPHV
jgi:hypothetical protein